MGVFTTPVTAVPCHPLLKERAWGAAYGRADVVIRPYEIYRRGM